MVQYPDQALTAWSPSSMSFRATPQRLKILCSPISGPKKWGNGRAFHKVKSNWWLSPPLAWEMSQLEKHTQECWSLPTYTCGLHGSQPYTLPSSRFLPCSSQLLFWCFLSQPVQESNLSQQDGTPSRYACRQAWQYEFDPQNENQLSSVIPDLFTCQRDGTQSRYACHEAWQSEFDSQNENQLL